MSAINERISVHENQARPTSMRQFFRVILKLVVSPGTFYEEVRCSREYTSPLLFLLYCSIVSSILMILYTAEKKMLLALIFFVNAMLTPFVMASILYLMGFLLCKGVFNYQTLFGITAYANVTLLASWIPGISWIAGLWRLYLIGLGMVKMGGIKSSRVILMLLAAAVILVLLLQLAQPVLRH